MYRFCSFLLCQANNFRQSRFRSLCGLASIWNRFSNRKPRGNVLQLARKSSHSSYYTQDRPHWHTLRFIFVSKMRLQTSSQRTSARRASVRMANIVVPNSARSLLSDSGGPTFASLSVDPLLLMSNHVIVAVPLGIFLSDIDCITWVHRVP